MQHAHPHACLSTQNDNGCLFTLNRFQLHIDKFLRKLADKKVDRRKEKEKDKRMFPNFVWET